MQRKYIFIVGGVMSGVGKGIAAASLGKIIQSRGFEVTAVKIDPYVNVDAGTMNPTEHGETFVLADGMECDQDLGNYERFLDRDLTHLNYMTTGSVYQAVINRERSLGYGGKCVEVVPHIPLEVLGRIERAGIKNKADIVITEIGGTAGEYQNILFLEAIRMLKIKKPKDVLLMLVSFLPTLTVGGTELKSKPTQYAVRTLNSAGLQPDMLIGRAASPLDEKRKKTIALNCNLNEEDIVSAPDVQNIYEVPIRFEKQHVSDLVLKKLGLRPRAQDLREWKSFVARTVRSKNPVRIGIVGKYFGSGNYMLADSYVSVIEAVRAAAFAIGRAPEIMWIDAEKFEKHQGRLKELSSYHGIIVPGGFGARGVEGKIAVIGYLREKKIPFFGLCYGMQLAVVEYARSVLGLRRAHTAEIDPKTPHPVIDVMPEQKKNMLEKDFGATMRLGAYPASLKEKTIAYRAYRSHLVSERHRHRYEVNPLYIERLEEKGMIFSGFSPDRKLMEIAELSEHTHPFFLGTQFHPELTSRPLKSHPLFREFLKKAAARHPSRP